MSASAAGALVVVRYLVGKAGAAVDARDAMGCTALMEAADEGQAEVVQCLVAEAGASVDASASDGRTALMVAAAQGHANIVWYLVTEGAASIDARDREGRTGLFYAALAGHEEAVQVLIEHGADACLKAKDGRTAMDACADTHPALRGYLEGCGSPRQPVLREAMLPQDINDAWRRIRMLESANADLRKNAAKLKKQGESALLELDWSPDGVDVWRTRVDKAVPAADVARKAAYWFKENLEGRELALGEKLDLPVLCLRWGRHVIGGSAVFDGLGGKQGDALSSVELLEEMQYGDRLPEETPLAIVQHEGRPYCVSERIFGALLMYQALHWDEVVYARCQVALDPSSNEWQRFFTTENGGLGVETRAEK